MKSEKTNLGNRWGGFHLQTIYTIFALGMMVCAASAAALRPGIVHVPVPVGGFSIDGDLSPDLSVGTGDWLLDNNATGSGVLNSTGTPIDPSFTFHLKDPCTSNEDFVFAGGMKWTDDPGTWKYTVGKSSPKTDINNVLMHVAEDAAGHTWLIIAADRLATSGDSYIDFEFLQKPVVRTSDGSFRSDGIQGGRTVNDIVLSLSFVGGGRIADFRAWRWEPTETGYGYVDATESLPADRVFMAANINNMPVPSVTFGQSAYAPNAFVEAAIDLTAFFCNLDSCLSVDLSTIVVKTKSSHSTSATIKDFIDPIPFSLRVGPSAYAGPDQVVCVDDGPAEFALSGRTSRDLQATTSARWSVVSGTAHIVSTDSLVTKALVTSRSATVRLTVHHGDECFETDDVVLNTVIRPEATIIGPKLVHPLSTSEFSAPPGFSSYSWNLTGDGAIVSPTDSSSVRVTAGAPGTHFSLILNAVSNVCSTSSTLNVTVTDSVPAPVIVSAVQSQTVTAGSDVSFTVVASGSDLTYQWQFNGSNLPGATGSTLNLTGVQLADAGSYTVLVTNPGGTVASTATLSVTAGTSVQPPVILSGPQSQTAIVGTDVTLTVQSGGTDLTYQWQHNGTNIAGATDSSLSLTNVQPTDAGTYTVIVTNPGGSVTSSATLVVTGTTVEPPTIISQPESQSVTAGTNVTLTVEAGGTDLTYQWQHNGTNIAGATDSSLSLTNVQPTDAGTYTVIVTNPGGTTTTDPIVLTVTDSVPAPVIVSAVQSQTVTAGSDVSFTVVASGSDLTYQWQFNGSNLPGATGSTLNLTGVQLADAGSYTVLVTNPGGTVASTATLSVTAGTSVQPPVILSGPQSQTAIVGTDVTLTVQSGGTDLTYQWQHNGTNIAGATDSSLSLTNVQPTDAGTYTVIVTNPGGSVTSSATLVVTGTTWNRRPLSPSRSPNLSPPAPMSPSPSKPGAPT